MDRPSIIAMALGSVSALTGREVVYDASGVLITVNPIIGATRRNQVDSNGTMTKIETKDFIISVLELVLAGNAVIPRAGHKIRVPLHGRISIFEVAPIGDEPEWRYSDPDETHYRIHTKFIGTQ